MPLLRIFMMLFVLAGLCCGAARAEDKDKDAELATELANPLANLISIPVQGNYNVGLGPFGEGETMFINLQPVVPFTLNEN